MRKSRLTIFAVVTVALALSLVCAVVYAQETEIVPSEGRTLLYTIGAWLIYSILGLVASLVTPSAAGQPAPKFDAYKFARSFLWAVIVAILSIGFGVHPTAIETQYSNFITEMVNFIGNSGFGLSLIYFFDKLYRILTGLAESVKVSAAAR